MQNSNNEPMQLTKSRILEPEVVAAGPEASGAGPKAGIFRTGTTAKRVEVGKGGCEIGKRHSFSHLETGFSHLFPHKSTQVVDFPRLSVVRVFSKDENSPPRRRDAEPRGGKS